MNSPSSGLQTMAPHRGVIFVLANCMAIVAAECLTIPSGEAVVLAGPQDSSPSQPAVSSGWRRAARGLPSPTYASTSQPVAPQKSDETVSGSTVSRLNDELNQLKADRESLKEVKARVTSESDPTEDPSSDRATE